MLISMTCDVLEGVLTGGEVKISFEVKSPLSSLAAPRCHRGSRGVDYDPQGAEGRPDFNVFVKKFKLWH